MEKVHKTLKELGLENREIKIYLTLIRQDMTALQISRSTKIDRTTIYDILEKLTTKGLASHYIKNKSKHFSVLTPKELLNYFQERYSSLKSIMPSLNEISKRIQNETKCEIFQKKEGIKTVLKDLINGNKDYKVINIKKEYENILGFFIDQGILKLDKLKAKETAIVEKGLSFTKLKNGNYRYLDKKLLSQTTTIIYQNTTVFLIWDEPYTAIRITNPTFTKTQTEYFKLLWSIASNNQN